MEKFLFVTSLLALTTFDDFGFSISSCKRALKRGSQRPLGNVRVNWDRGASAILSS